MPPVLVVERRPTLTVFLGGQAITHVERASWSGGFNQSYNTGTVTVTQLPIGFDIDQTMQIVAGNGVNHVSRMYGLTRDPTYTIEGKIQIQIVGQMARAYEYENTDDPSLFGGLDIFDLMGGPRDGYGRPIDSATDEEVVRAVLRRAGIQFSDGNIGGTGVTFGQFIVPGLTSPFLWSSGNDALGFPSEAGKGETAWEYIQRWDAISAVHPGPFHSITDGTVDPASGRTIFSGNSPGNVSGAKGFFRTYETLVTGQVHRSLIGGRPNGSVTISTPFTEGTDIRYGSRITRGRPTANRFQAIGYQAPNNSGPEKFTMQSSNTYMPSNYHFTAPTVSSPMIEKSIEALFPTGMSCEKITYALEPNYNRIIVSGAIVTGRDDPISYGATILVQGPGGQPSRLGTGENVWVQGVRGSVSMQGFVQEFEVLGGGVDSDLPGVPQ